MLQNNHGYVRTKNKADKYHSHVSCCSLVSHKNIRLLKFYKYAVNMIVDLK